MTVDTEMVDEVMGLVKKFSLEEMRELNRRLVQQIRSARRKKNLTEALLWEVDDRCVFEHKGREIHGTVRRVNKNSLSVDSDSHGKWRVSYEHAHHEDESEAVGEGA